MSDKPTTEGLPQDENQIIAERRAKLARLRERGQAFPNDFRREHLAEDLHAAHGGKTKEQLEAEKPGPVMRKRASVSSNELRVGGLATATRRAASGGRTASACNAEAPSAANIDATPTNHNTATIGGVFITP